MRSIAAIGVGSQFDVRKSPAQARLLSGARVESLTAQEETSAALEVLSRRYTPALALANRHVWPVDVSYSWHDGSGVYTETAAGARQLVIPHGELSRYHAPPAPIGSRVADRFYVDGPGGGRSDGSWIARWKHIQGEGSPKDAAYAPTQYVHAFWLNRAEGLLALQYWFYYPYNDWVNRHEADWEHVVVVLKGDAKLEDADRFSRHGHLFYFHDWIHEPSQTLTLGGNDTREDHVVVFVGGSGDLWKLWRCGRRQSGGSYPWPGVYSRAGSAHEWLAPSERIGQAQRYLAPEDFRLVILPEPSRISADHRPELWWLAWPLHFGQRRVTGNFPLLSALGLDHPPKHPGWHQDWNAARTMHVWPGHVSRPARPALPEAWAARLTATSGQLFAAR